MIELKGYQPICVLDKKILLYKRSSFYLYDKDDGNISSLIKLPQNFANRIKSYFRLSSRLFRMEIRNAIKHDSHNILFFHKKKLYCLNITNRVLKAIYQTEKNVSTPLNLCKTIETSKYITVFGDYGDNPNHNEVSIYGVRNDYTVEIIYTFKPNSIRHIHNIIADPIQNGYYVFTGDNEPESGIYWTDKNFADMIPVLIGKQDYRAVSGFVTNEGLLYATDSITETNKLFHLKISNNNHVLEEISKINGSCIYGTQTNSGYYFSTTVESGETKNNKLKSLLSMKSGAGILSNKVHLLHVTKALEVKIIKIFEKDKLPYKLFQYGAVRFPCGQENQDELVIYPVSVKYFDGDTVVL